MFVNVYRFNPTVRYVQQDRRRLASQLLTDGNTVCRYIRTGLSYSAEDDSCMSITRRVLVCVLL